jgi:tetratricopeptide (TPR) repeat protein
MATKKPDATSTAPTPNQTAAARAAARAPGAAPAEPPAPSKPAQQQRRPTMPSPVRPGAPAKAKSTGAGRVPTADELAKLKEMGQELVAYDRADLEKFLLGSRTLGEIEGISKAEQYKMAEVGYRLLSEGKLKDGRDVFAGLCALDPFDAYFLTCWGSAQQQLGELEEALRLYSRALEINPFSPTARTHRGEIWALQGNLQDAIADLTRVMTDDPEAKDPATKRAAVLLKAIAVQLKSVS